MFLEEKDNITTIQTIPSFRSSKFVEEVILEVIFLKFF